MKLPESGESHLAPCTAFRRAGKTWRRLALCDKGLRDPVGSSEIVLGYERPHQFNMVSALQGLTDQLNRVCPGRDAILSGDDDGQHGSTFRETGNVTPAIP